MMVSPFATGLAHRHSVHSSSEMVHTRTVLLANWYRMSSLTLYAPSRKVKKLIKLHQGGLPSPLMCWMESLSAIARELVTIPVIKKDDCHRLHARVLDIGKRCRKLGLHDPWNFPIFVDRKNRSFIIYSLGDLDRDHADNTDGLSFVYQLLINTYRRYTTIYHLVSRATQERCANIFRQLENIELKSG